MYQERYTLSSLQIVNIIITFLSPYILHCEAANPVLQLIIYRMYATKMTDISQNA